MLTPHETQASIKDYWGFTSQQMAHLMEIKTQSYHNKLAGYRNFTDVNIDTLKKNLLSKIKFYLEL